METPTASGRQPATKALLRSVALLSLACAATAPAAPCAAGVCDSAARELEGADILLGELRDLGDLGAAEGVEPAVDATESLAPLLFLAPRVTSILEDVFQADTKAADDDGTAEAATGAEPAPQAALRSPVAETDPAAHGPSPETDHASILPKYQRQMYRTDI